MVLSLGSSFKIAELSDLTIEQFLFASYHQELLSLMVLRHSD